MASSAIDGQLSLIRLLLIGNSGVGELPAEILKLMGVSSVRLITNNPAKVEALELAGIKVVERISAEVPTEPTNERYLQTKREKMGHLVS